MQRTIVSIARICARGGSDSSVRDRHYQTGPPQDGRIYVEKINGPFLLEEYKAGLDLAMKNGWLEMHECGTYVKPTEAGAALVA